MADEDGTAAWVSVRTPLRGLVFDAQKCFGTGGPVGCRTPSRAAMENLGRTLSVEWARYAVTAVAVRPGSARTGEELAQLVCFLLSPAGEYMSGCQFELGGLG